MDLKNKKILVFTGGGLSPALNPIFYGVIKEAKKRKAKIYGGFFGWHCLSDKGKIVSLNNFNEEEIKNKGGSFLRSSRTNPYKFKNGIKELKENIEKKKIDYLVAVGGNDTLEVAFKLFKEEKIKIVGAPKTIDNDLDKTFFSPGFPTAAYKLIQFVKEIKETAAPALSRIFIIEVMGEKSGWLVASSYLGGADVIIPPEKYIDIDRVIKKIAFKYKKNGNFAVVAISKEAQLGNKIKGVFDDQYDGYGNIRHDLKCLDLKKEIKKRIGAETKILIPGNWLQAGNPIDIDRQLSIKLGKKAVSLLANEKFGWVGIIKKRKDQLIIRETTLEKIIKKTYLDENYFDFKNLVPRKKFINYIKSILPSI